MSVYAGPNTVQSGLVLHIDPSNPRSYPGSGSTLFDLSGNGNSGTLTNGASVVSQRSGRVLSFDGVNDFVNCGDILDSVFTGASAKFTITSWVYALSTAETTCIVGKIADSVLSENQRQILFYLKNGYLTVLWYGTLTASSLIQLQCPILIPLNTWTHIGMTFDATIADSSQKCNLFINGNLVSYSILLNLSSPSSIQNGTAPLAIGASVSTNGLSSIYGFNGNINDTRIYNRVLSNQEFSQLFNATRGRYGI